MSFYYPFQRPRKQIPKQITINLSYLALQLIKKKFGREAEIYLTFLKLHTSKPSVPKLSPKSSIIISNVNVSLLGFWVWGICAITSRHIKQTAGQDEPLQSSPTSSIWRYCISPDIFRPQEDQELESVSNQNLI